MYLIFYNTCNVTCDSNFRLIVSWVVNIGGKYIFIWINLKILAFWKYSYSMKQRGQNGMATGNIRSEIEKFFGKWKEDHFGFWWYFIHNWPCTVEI